MIFISYRKEDAGDLAWSLADKLIELFGKDAIFLDKHKIEPGDKWQEEIDNALKKAVVVLALIGRQWLTTYDEYGQRRIDRDDDVLAYELFKALEQGIMIIPLYLHGLKPMPPKAFPTRLSNLAGQQGIEFEISRDLPKLLEKLEAIPDLKTSSIKTTDGRKSLKGVSKPWCIPDSIGRFFKGRTDAVCDIRNKFLQESDSLTGNAVKRQVIFGLGGIGKTRLAIEYAWEYQNSYIALLFVVADTPIQLRRSLAELSAPAILNLQEWKVPEEEIRMAAVLRWLSENPGWLLIIDNADRKESVDAVQTMLTNLRAGHVLITSRSSWWSKSVTKNELDVLPLEAAKTFLLDRTNDERRKTPQDETVASDLANELGGLALALEQAGAYIQNRDGGLSLADYLARWREGKEQVLAWCDESVMHYSRSVAITWETTMRTLSPAALVLFRIMSCFAPEPIPRHMVSNPGIYKIVKDTAEKTGLSAGEIDPEQALSELIAYSMTKKVDGHGVACVSLHRVVLQIMHDRMPGEAKNASIVAAQQLLVIFAPKESYRPEAWTEWRLLITHAETIWNVLQELPEEYWNIELMKMLALYYLGQSRNVEAVPIQRSMLRLAQNRLSPDDPEIFTAKNDLALMLPDTEFKEAHQLFREALAGRERVHGMISEEVGETLHNLGLSLKQSDLDESEKLLRRALLVFEKISGPMHWRTLMTEYSLSLTLHAKGEVTEAEHLLLSNIEKKEQHLRKGHPDILASITELAEIYFEQNKKKEAVELADRYLHALDLSSEFDSPLSLRQLALLFYVNGQYLKAEELLRKVLKFDFEVAGNLCHLTRVLILTGREKEGREAIARAWNERAKASDYIIPRVLWFQILFALLDNQNPAREIGLLKTALNNEAAYAEWKMNPVLDYLITRLSPENNAFLSKLISAFSNPNLRTDLELFEIWRIQTPIPFEISK